MKKFSAYRRSAGFVMVVMMSVQVCSGLGIFCSNTGQRPFPALGIASSHLDRGEVVGSARDHPENQGGTSKCCCKKQKQCPAIPRAAITSNPTHRLNEVQRLCKSVCFHTVVGPVTGQRLVTGSGPPLMEWVGCAPFYSSTPLEYTCVLLI